MTSKDAFNSACEILCAKYSRYGFRYLKSKKQIKGTVNDTEIYIDIETSRDNSSDYFVCFKPSGRVVKNGVPVFCLHKVEPNDEALFSDNLTVDVSENNKALPEEYRNTFSDTILTRMWTGPYFQCWNVAYPEQQVKAAEEAALWLDKRLFSNEQVVSAIGETIKGI